MIKKEDKKMEKYFEGVGRRKTSVARVRIFEKNKGFNVNDKDLKKYFALSIEQIKAQAPLGALNVKDKFGVSAKVYGGGTNSQSEAVRHGLARALVKFDSSFRKVLSTLGYLRRDPRMVERKKYGLKKARRAPQWAKR